jgi:beta-lactamase class D
MNARRWLAALTTLAAAAAVATHAAPPLVERPAWQRHFDEAGVRGTFLLYDAEADRWLVHDAERAQRRFIPASTFKVLNSLIALETGAIADTATVLPFDGHDGGRPEIARDLDMREAFRLSAVWFYQQLARRVGAERMQAFLERVDYGNASIAPRVDRFWLDGELRISPREQVAFLDRVRRGDVPFSAPVVRAVHDIMVVERADGATLRAKTGWGRPDDGEIGWYVGWVDGPAGAHVFALNIDIETSADAAARRQITRQILREAGVFP